MSNEPQLRGKNDFSSLSFTGLIAHAARSGMIYTLGLVATRLGDFLLIPLYWSLLSPSDYGVIAIATIFSEFLTAVFGLGLPESITRYYYEWEGEQRKRHLGAIWTMAWASSIVMAFILMGMGDILGRLITQLPFSPYLELAIWIAVCNSSAQAPLFLFRTMEKASFYIGTSFLTFILNTVLAIFFVVNFPQDGALAVLAAQAISGVLMMIFYAAVLMVWTTPNIRYHNWSIVLGFSLPLVPSKIIAAAAGVIDRFLLEKFISLNDLGLYQVTIRFARALALVTNGLRTAWIPFQMRILSERIEDGRAVVGRVAPYFIVVVLVAAIGLSTILGDLISILNIEAYLPVIIFLPFAVMPEALNGITTIVIQGYIIAKKTQYAWIRTSTQLIAAVIAGVILIPSYEIYGAFAASTISGLAGGIVGYALSAQFYYIPFPWQNILWLTSVALFAIMGVRLVDTSSDIVSLGISSIILLIYALWALLIPLDGYVWMRQNKQRIRNNLLSVNFFRRYRK